MSLSTNFQFLDKLTNDMSWVFFAEDGERAGQARSPSPAGCTHAWVQIAIVDGLG